MARFDVYANPVADERRHTPYLLDLQNDHLEGLASRVVAPLRAAPAFALPLRDLNPRFEIDGKSVVLDTSNLAAVPATALRRKVGTLDAHRGAVLDALDTLFGSF